MDTNMDKKVALDLEFRELANKYNTDYGYVQSNVGAEARTELEDRWLAAGLSREIMPKIQQQADGKHIVIYPR